MLWNLSQVHHNFCLLAENLLVRAELGFERYWTSSVNLLILMYNIIQVMVNGVQDEQQTKDIDFFGFFWFDRRVLLNILSESTVFGDPVSWAVGC